MDRRGRGPAYPREVIEYARSLASDRNTPTRIRALLEEEYPDWVPSLAQVKRWVADVGRAQDEPWAPVRAPVQECRDMAPLLAHGLAHEPGRGFPDRWPTASEAAWMLRVRAWRPDLPDVRVWQTGRYIAGSPPVTQQWLVGSLLSGADVTIKDGRATAGWDRAMTLRASSTPRPGTPEGPEAANVEES